MVTSGHRLATQQGLEILRQGGNVVDAAITTSLCLGVAEPYGSGLGGKLVLLFREAQSGRVFCIEALCPSSRRIDPQRFTALTREQRRRGYHSVGVPGLPAGLQEAHRRWGRLPWSQLVQPAVDLARQGITVDAKMRSMFEPKLDGLQSDTEVARLYLVNGQLPEVGDQLVNDDLANTLAELGQYGADAFYAGTTARKIAAAASAAGAPLSFEDFTCYQPRVLDSLSSDYRGFCVYASPPPLTGGITVLMGLEMMEPRHRQSVARSEWIDGVGRSLQCIYPLVREAIGDRPDARCHACSFLQPSHVERLIQLAAELDPADPHADEVLTGTTPRDTADSVEHDTVGSTVGDDLDDASTSQLCVADRAGNMVSITQSLSLHFGACVIAPGTGVLLNDSMSNFSTRKPASVNYVGPNKRARSTVTPIIITRQKRPVACLGIPGGQRIPTTTLQLISQMIDQGKTLSQAIDQSRFHLRRPLKLDSAPNAIDLEEGVSADLSSKLKSGGWKIESKPRDGHYFGGGNGITYAIDGRLNGVADLRRTNFAQGE